MKTDKKILWSELTLYAEGESTNDPETLAGAMKQYRAQGTIDGFFLSANEDWDADPKPEEIDFAGLDEALSEFEV